MTPNTKKFEDMFSRFYRLQDMNMTDGTAYVALYLILRHKAANAWLVVDYVITGFIVTPTFRHYCCFASIIDVMINTSRCVAALYCMAGNVYRMLFTLRSMGPADHPIIAASAVSAVVVTATHSENQQRVRNNWSKHHQILNLARHPGDSNWMSVNF